MMKELSYISRLTACTIQNHINDIDVQCWKRAGNTKYTGYIFLKEIKGKPTPLISTEPIFVSREDGIEHMNLIVKDIVDLKN